MTRRNSSWDEIQAVFSKIVTIFPAKVKEVFLLYQYPAGLFLLYQYPAGVFLL
jgi:hypothetical protein